MFVTQIGEVSASATTPLYRDPLIRGGAVKFAFDLSFNYSWPGAATPLDGAVIYDMSDNGNGEVDIIAGQSVAYAGGGFDFNGLTNDPVVVKAPVGCLASIWGDGIVDTQHFLVSGIMKFPSSSDWNTISTIAPLFCTSTNLYTTEADMVTISYRDATRLSARRQTNGSSTVNELTITATANIFGQVGQWGYWRTAAGTGLRIKTALGELIATGAAGVQNTGDFSAKQPRWGIPEASNRLIDTTAHRNTHKTRLYSGFVEDLASGRTPIDVLDEEWARQVARGDFS
ncbi:MAG: hypothetical protein EOQ56_04295 [Mesorhizobium sp.]|nr:MAG: hypothetical protein EOQ56_04295 [Mesorhizobium sp.]